MKTIVITGVTGAVGKAAAEALARQKDLKLILIGRDISKLKELGDKLQKQGAAIETVVSDMADPASVKAAVNKIKSGNSSINALVNIAAVYKSKKTLTNQHQETMFATNHLGPFTLTTGLMPLLEAAQGAKVITVAAPTTTKLDFENLNGEKKFSALSAFGASKMMNLLMTFKLAELEKNRSVASMAFHPGLVRSELLKESPAFIRGLFRMISSPPEKAGKTIADLVLNGDLKEQNGKFYTINSKQMKAAAYAHDKGIQEKLWSLSSRLAGQVQ